MISFQSTLNRTPVIQFTKGKRASGSSKISQLGNTKRYTAHKSVLGPKTRASRFSGNSFGDVKVLPFQTLRAQPRRVTVRYYASSAPVDVPLKLGIDSVNSGIVSGINFAVGDFVAIDTPVVTLETDKVEIEVKAPFDGIIQAINVELDAEIEENTVVFKIAPAEASAAPKKEAPKAEAPKKEAPKAAPKSEAPAPKAEAPKAKEALKAEPKSSEPKVVNHITGRAETREKMKPIRVRIAERLKDSQNTAAMLTTFQEIDMHEITNLRSKLKDQFFEEHGVKLGFMSAFVRASSIALRKYPLVNSVIDTESNEIIHRNYHDISVAVSSPKGLVVPVIRNAETLSFAGIEKTIADLAVAARDNKLTMEDMSGGTFTISNGGVFGSLFGTPIINPPQSAILGMHATTRRAVVVGDEIKIRPVMFVALTYDHRLIDGREAVLFLKTIKHCIEDPNRMLLDL